MLQFNFNRMTGNLAFDVWLSHRIIMFVFIAGKILKT